MADVAAEAAEVCRRLELAIALLRTGDPVAFVAEWLS
jgi:hypothetical protein